MAEQSDEFQKAERALLDAERELRALGKGELSVDHPNITVSDGVIGGRLIRVVSIISEKHARAEE